MNKLYYGDCLTIMRDHMKLGSVDLIYLDPPFNSNRDYNAIYKDETGRPLPDQIEAFCDLWTLDEERERAIRNMPILMRDAGLEDGVAEFWKVWMNALRHTQPRLLAYLSYMVERLLLMKTVLKPTGSIYLHCDPTASHYIKVMMDGIFDHQETIQHLNSIRGIFNEINNFRIAEGDPSSRRDGIVNNLREVTQQVMSSIGLWLPLLALRAGEIENWTARMREISDDGTRLLQEMISYADTRKKEIDETAQAARAAAGEAGAAEFTHEFRKEAETAEERSKMWLYPAAGSAGLALLGAISLIFGWLGDAPTNTWEAVYRLSGRVIALSVLFHAAIWSGRIVLANMHQASVNKHRAVSLQTLQAFHSAAEDAAAKDAVVLEAARAVYENVPSGYIGRQANERGGNARTLEIIRGANRMSRASDGDRSGP